MKRNQEPALVKNITYYLFLKAFLCGDLKNLSWVWSIRANIGRTNIVGEKKKIPGFEWFIGKSIKLKAFFKAMDAQLKSKKIVLCWDTKVFSTYNRYIPNSPNCLKYSL